MRRRGWDATSHSRRLFWFRRRAIFLSFVGNMNSVNGGRLYGSDELLVDVVAKQLAPEIVALKSQYPGAEASASTVTWLLSNNKKFGRSEDDFFFDFFLSVLRRKKMSLEEANAVVHLVAREEAKLPYPIADMIKLLSAEHPQLVEEVASGVSKRLQRWTLWKPLKGDSQTAADIRELKYGNLGGALRGLPDTALLQIGDDIRKIAQNRHVRGYFASVFSRHFVQESDKLPFYEALLDDTFEEMKKPTALVPLGYVEDVASNALRGLCKIGIATPGVQARVQRMIDSRELHSLQSGWEVGVTTLAAAGISKEEIRKTLPRFEWWHEARFESFFDDGVTFKRCVSEG